MDKTQKTTPLIEKPNSSRRKGWWELFLWAVLIVAGIVAKRVYGYPDMMVFFHLPAAVFLVLAFYRLSEPNRKAFQIELKKIRAAHRKRQKQN